MQQFRVWIGIACCLISLMSACKKVEMTTESSASPTPAPVKQAVPSTQVLPADLPIIEGTVKVQKQHKNTVLLKIATNLATSEVIAYYQQQLSKKGWTNINTTEAPHGTVIQSTKPAEKRSCTVVIGSSTDGTVPVDLSVATQP